MRKYFLIAFALILFASCEEQPGKYTDEKGYVKGGGKTSGRTSGKSSGAVKGSEKNAPTPPVNSSTLSSNFAPPDYLGGKDEWNKYLKANVQLPDSIKLKNVEGKVEICLTISKTGEVLKSELISSIKRCPECTKEAFRVVNNVKKWKPAVSIQANGTKVEYTEKLVVEIPFKKGK